MSQGDSNGTHKAGQQRLYTYGLTAVILCACYGLVAGANWRSSANVHTVMEVLATTLALMVGAMSLVRFYTRRNSKFLLIGVGFVGTAVLDGFHAIVTSSPFIAFMPSDQPSLIPWSWFASRLFLSLLMLLSVIVWRYEQKTGRTNGVSETNVYLGLSALTLFVLIFFILVPLPRAYFEEFFIQRPEEWVPAALFGAALWLYLRKGHWRTDLFEHWLVLSIIVGLVGQLVFMPFSTGLFDGQFDAAHILKKLGYVCVLAGLFISMFQIFRQSEQDRTRLQDSEGRMRTILDTMTDAVVTINDRGIIQSVNPAINSMFGYGSDELLGNNIKVLMNEEDAVRHDGYIADYHDSKGRGIVDGAPRTLSARRKDGGSFLVDVGIGRATISGQEIFIGVLRDVTERQNNAERLMQAQKAETIAKISGGVAHDFNNALQAIMGSIELASMNLPDDSDVQKFVKMQSVPGRMLQT